MHVIKIAQLFDIPNVLQSVCLSLYNTYIYIPLCRWGWLTQLLYKNVHLKFCNYNVNNLMQSTSIFILLSISYLPPSHSLSTLILSSCRCSQFRAEKSIITRLTPRQQAAATSRDEFPAVCATLFLCQSFPQISIDLATC